MKFEIEMTPTFRAWLRVAGPYWLVEICKTAVYVIAGIKIAEWIG